ASEMAEVAPIACRKRRRFVFEVDSTESVGVSSVILSRWSAQLVFSPGSAFGGSAFAVSMHAIRWQYHKCFY
ncbi:hypothetical protein, partial [Halorubrum sp. Ea1]|uniref:hypothetical protein n=1 Tax=Halorubrum sp. Ea1 TaxID=1480718 RepID=UPI001C3D1E07